MTKEATKLATKPPNTGGEPCPFEEFNFSKAAIKFSQSLTKDQVLSGLKAVVQRLGELISSGSEVEMSLGDIVRLVWRGDKEPRVSFSPELLAAEGNEAPATAVDEGFATKPTVAAFRRDAPEESKGLQLRGVSQADSGGGYVKRQATPPPRMMPPVEEDNFYEEVAPQPLGMSASEPRMGTPGEEGSLTNGQYKKEVAYKEAMDRHISSMEARASEAMQEREAWQSHVNECLVQERDELEQKRTRAQMNLSFLQHQMEIGEERRREQRKEEIVAASAHDFPKFTEPVAEEMKDFVHGQQARMRADLDEQVRTNNTLKNLAKQRERALEINQLEANRKEMAMLRNAERAKKAYDREALATAWNSEIRMKNIWKAIDSHNKVGSQKSANGPQVLGLMDDGLSMPPSRGSCASAGRLMTGSSRRIPLGASSSLGRLDTGKLSNA